MPSSRELRCNIKIAYTFFLKIGIHSMQGWAATTRNSIYKKKKAQKRLQDKENLFRKNLQLKHVC